MVHNEALELKEWHDFFFALSCVSSTLAGLIFIAVSNNLKRILEFPHLVTRALEALVTLISAVMISLVMLMPFEPEMMLGLAVVTICSFTWIFQIRALIQTRNSGYERPLRIVLNQSPSICYLTAGILMSLSRSDAFLWFIPGSILSIFSAVYFAWVLLVEIQKN